MSKSCRVCGNTLPQTAFWKYKAPNTHFLTNKKFITYHTCRDCCLKRINPSKPETFLPILQEMNIPYWKMIYEQYADSTNQFGKYLACMRLGNLYDLEYKDTKFLNEKWEGLKNE